ncbi:MULTISPECIES: SDR family NAD(P)-dependent oxidoreductase [unclassified Pseudofrankia]|uniref:SDR family NAD(P)-dependent oxidoreductase n=1 Tax=unclassified Pseudofrankia TaxID=2994372 RepID=UPI0008D9A79B|nr:MULTISPECIES: SDR family NAD(P)-dependent oxidoreductase [unclassified Pseudofrankia]MDT3442919.1 SDR family NAD(P)-dependent oxidoreductase [Pseudofrankia sp. BMG5.37]OHV62866.1 oxidoreductase [Pseudofrankia sp. BMG5.36]
MATRFTTPFGRESTSDDVLAGVDLSGQRAVVTGATSGIGTETARALAAAGAEVTVAVRNVEAGKQVAAQIAASTGGATVNVAPLDLADRSTIDEFTSSWRGPLHMLVNNAGVMMLPTRQLTREGVEYHFGANHLGHVALTLGLYAPLAAAGGRVVSVTSDAHAHARGVVDFDDINFDRRDYNGGLAYAQSKTANVLFAVELNRRWAEDGVTANAVHPGQIRTKLQRHVEAMDLPAEVRAGMDRLPWRSTEQGAATSVLLAASPLLEGIGGLYFENCNQAIDFDTENPPAEFDAPGVGSWAIDPETATRLWRVSLKLLAG